MSCLILLINSFELLIFNSDKSIGKELIVNPLPDDFFISLVSCSNIIFFNFLINILYLFIYLFLYL